jgi:dethiobiotin synthetase
MRPEILFITGTDTGVGKTLLTALLLCHLRGTGSSTCAIKPFCTGDRADALLLESLQAGELTLEEINPFYFPKPLAPLVASRLKGQCVRLRDALDHLRAMRVRTGIAIRSNRRRSFGRKIAATDLSGPATNHPQKWDRKLIVEGVGGVLVPLGENYSVLDLIKRLGCRAIVVARNKLGTINHTRCTVEALQNAGVQHIMVVLMGVGRADASAESNAEILSEILALPVVELPYLGKKALKIREILSASKKLKKTLALLAG